MLESSNDVETWNATQFGAMVLDTSLLSLSCCARTKGWNMSEVTVGRDAGAGGVFMGWFLGLLGMTIWFFYAMSTADDAKAKIQSDRENSGYAHQHYHQETAVGGTTYGTD